MWETRVQSLGQEDLLEQEMAIYSSILAWKIPWTEEPGRLQSMGLQRVGHDERLHFFSFLRREAGAPRGTVWEQQPWKVLVPVSGSPLPPLHSPPLP